MAMGTSALPFTVNLQTVKEELERVLRSRVFAQAFRSQEFLRYAVERSLPDNSYAERFLKEYSIAVDVFGRNPNYDPAVDATVRVEAGRLRNRLREYYADEGRNNPLVIEMPKGGYRVTFREREEMRLKPTFEWRDRPTGWQCRSSHIGM